MSQEEGWSEIRGQVTHGPAEQGGYRVVVQVPGPPVPHTPSLPESVLAEQESVQSVNEQGHEPFRV